MRAPPTTVEIIEELALRDPLRPALREEGSELNYGQLYALLVHCAFELQRLGLRRGERVAVAGPGFGIQLVLLLAAEGLGAATASFQAQDDADAAFLFAQVDRVFSGRAQMTPPGVPFHLIDDAFVRRLAGPLGAERPAWAPLELHETQRITRTSGSSGRSKFMLLSRRAQEHWIPSGIEKASYGPGTRLLNLGPLVINAAFTRCSFCLRRGGALLWGPGEQLPQMEPTHVWGLPLQIERLLREAPAGYVSPRPVMVSSVGGVLPPKLREAIARVFGAAVRNRYGSNEAGGICEDVDAEGVGLLCAGVDVRILGPDGQDLPSGQSGTIAVRTPCMSEAYLDLPADTAAAFRDGWFISSDVGALVGYRRLQLLGRQDDLVNLGGIKVPASRIEADLRQQPAIADCAVQAVHLQAGAVTLGLAVVLATGASQEEASAQLQQALRLAGDTMVRVLFLSELPRMHTGKTDRMALLRMFGQAAAT